MKTHYIESQTYANLVYILRDNGDLQVTCTCKGFENRGRCKHVVAYIAARDYPELPAAKACVEAIMRLNEGMR